MDIARIPAGANPPTDVNVVIEIPGGAAGGDPVKYEIDKDSGALFVDRINSAPMFYPANYGFVPNTLHDDGDPIDVLVRTEVRLQPGAVVRCRLLGVLNMEDDGGVDDKLLAAPIDKVDPFQADIQSIDDLPQRYKDRVRHFFENYKSLDPGKWVKVRGWAGRTAAEDMLMRAIHAARG